MNGPEVLPSARQVGATELGIKSLIKNACKPKPHEIDAADSELKLEQELSICYSSVANCNIAELYSFSQDLHNSTSEVSFCRVAIT